MHTPPYQPPAVQQTAVDPMTIPVQMTDPAVCSMATVEHPVIVMEITEEEGAEEEEAMRRLMSHLHGRPVHLRQDCRWWSC